MNPKHNTSKKREHSQDSYAKQATDWIADQFKVTKSIKARDKANTQAGQAAANKKNKK